MKTNSDNPNLLLRNAVLHVSEIVSFLNHPSKSALIGDITINEQTKFSSVRNKIISVLDKDFDPRTRDKIMVIFDDAASGQNINQSNSVPAKIYYHIGALLRVRGEQKAGNLVRDLLKDSENEVGDRAILHPKTLEVLFEDHPLGNSIKKISGNIIKLEGISDKRNGDYPEGRPAEFILQKIFQLLTSLGEHNKAEMIKNTFLAEDFRLGIEEESISLRDVNKKTVRSNVITRDSIEVLLEGTLCKKQALEIYDTVLNSPSSKLKDTLKRIDQKIQFGEVLLAYLEEGGTDFKDFLYHAKREMGVETNTEYSKILGINNRTLNAWMERKETGVLITSINQIAANNYFHPIRPVLLRTSLSLKKLNCSIGTFPFQLILKKPYIGFCRMAMEWNLLNRGLFSR